MSSSSRHGDSDDEFGSAESRRESESMSLEASSEASSEPAKRSGKGARATKAARGAVVVAVTDLSESESGGDRAVPLIELSSGDSSESHDSSESRDAASLSGPSSDSESQPPAVVVPFRDGEEAPRDEPREKMASKVPCCAFTRPCLKILA